MYGNSFLTIAATSAMDCDGGCGLEPWKLDIIEGMSNPFYEWTNKIGPRYHIKLKRCEPLHGLLPGATGSMKQPPLHTRGWVLQEALLSRRVLNMMPRQMVWQCRSKFQYEFNSVIPHYYGVPHTLLEAGFLVCYNEKTERWSIVENYIQRDFTYPMDRMPAFAGIFQLWSAHRDDQPLLGLWTKTIAFDLGWRHAKPQGTPLSVGPTWSWLSYTTKCIKKPYSSSLGSNVPRHQTTDFIWEVLRYQTSDLIWEGEPFVSKLVSATISVKSRIFETAASLVYGKNTAIKKNFYRSVLRPYLKDAKDKGIPIRQVRSEYYSDYIIRQDAARTINIAFARLYSKNVFWDIEVHYLALLAIPDKPQSYNRLGYGRVMLELDSSSPVALAKSHRNGSDSYVLAT